jgi:hypothetical protein
MDAKTMLIPLVVSNLVALLLLLSAWKKPKFARLLFFLLFAGGSLVNTRTALLNPQVYQVFAETAWFGFYREFITGFFAAHTTPIILAIAAGQLGVGLGMLGSGWFFRLGCIGGMLFLLAIAPLGLGSAFPFSLIAGAGFWLLYRRGSDHMLWSREEWVRPAGLQTPFHKF